MESSLIIVLIIVNVVTITIIVIVVFFFETGTSLFISDNIRDLSSECKSIVLRAKELEENTS